MQRIDHPLLSPSLGSHKTLTSFHFGKAGTGLKIYIQASLHAEELPGMLAAYHLRPLLEAAEAAGKARLEYAIASERINKLNAASQAFGSALSNSTTPTSLLPASRKFTLPSYFFDRVGKALLLRASGRISTVVTTPGTLTLDVKLGSVVVFSSGDCEDHSRTIEAVLKVLSQKMPCCCCNSICRADTSDLQGCIELHERGLGGAGALPFLAQLAPATLEAVLYCAGRFHAMLAPFRAQALE